MLNRGKEQEVGLTDNAALRRAALVGIVLQVALAVLAHYAPWIGAYANRLAGMMISATAGYLYAMDVGLGFRRGALGGAIVGGVSGLAGMMLAQSLGERPDDPLALWTMISVLTGTLGGVFGEIAIRWNAILRRWLRM
jgi:hypothetical protein